ncbi:MAG: hypothetical protein ACYC8V_11265 [Caulobacteraceae bacterium]
MEDPELEVPDRRGGTVFVLCCSAIFIVIAGCAIYIAITWSW